MCFTPIPVQHPPTHSAVLFDQEEAAKSLVKIHDDDDDCDDDDDDGVVDCLHSKIMKMMMKMLMK